MNRNASLLLSFLATLTLVASPAWSEGPTQDEIARAHSWAADHFGGKRTQALPYSFTYAGNPSATLVSRWKTVRKTNRLDSRRIQHALTSTDPATGLSVMCEAVEFRDYPTVEWTLRFKNTGKKNTPVISDIRPMDVSFSRTRSTEFQLHWNTADNCTQDSYAPHVEPLLPGANKPFASAGGRPTTGGYPYWNVEMDGGGVLAVLSWGGQWSATFTRDAGRTLSLRAGQELTHFVLHPGEEVASPLALLQFYDGDWIHGQNVWRRWMFAHNIPKTTGKLSFPMRYGCDGDLYPGLRTDLEGEKASIKAFCDQGLAPDTWDQDAGWYPCDPKIGWPQVGTWEPDTARFPGGMKSLSDFLHANGIKFILWAEPERTSSGTWITQNHPEWVYGGAGGGLVKLGDPACRQWMTDRFDKLITTEGVDIYRQDFNINPLAYWRKNDTADRQGITEIRHVEGYYTYWDELRHRHPGLLIDTCASGGRRNNLETLRRSVPILRSDYTGDPIGNQGHTYGLSLWVPVHGTGLNFKGNYDNRSAMAPIFGIGWDVKKPGCDWNLMRRTAKEWRQLGTCMLGDYYPLTPYSLAKGAWIAFQFDRPEKGEGMVEAFRRDEAREASLVVKLRGLNRTARYSVTNLDTGLNQVVTGRILMDGLRVEIAANPGSALVAYKRVPR